MAELLFEVGTEELPPSGINSLTNQIKENIKKGLAENYIEINESETKTYSTPRRIAIKILNLPKKQETKTIEIKGPAKNNAYDKTGNPTQAAIGFAKKYNLEPKDLTVKKVDGIEYLFAVTKVGGKDTKTLLSSILPNSLKQTAGDKFMSWGNYEEKFARPIRWILAILDSEVVEFSYANIKSSNYTFGHRLLSSKRVESKDPTQYEEVLKKNHVIASTSIRLMMIEEGVRKEANKVNSVPIDDKDLNEEVANITEYPSPLLCSFEKDFLSLPSCVIETVLKKHQRYFVLKGKDNNLSNNFVVITNGKNSEQVKRGNEKVVRARLNDAKFFYLEDLKRPFTYEERINDLAKITFQKGLGSMKEKVERIVKLSAYISNSEDIKLAAQLCKLDLTTHMVFELPELQGEIGGIYAHENKFNKNICEGISEHYSQAPTSITGTIVGIADKLDNITSLFAIDKIPTGSTDPFALRRQAQSIIDTILNKKELSINLLDLINHHASSSKLKEKLTNEKITLIKDFLLDKFITRMKILPGYEVDTIAAVCSVGEPLSNLSYTEEKIKIVNEYFYHNKEHYKPFLVAAKRLVRIVENNNGFTLESSNLKTEYEVNLLKRFEELDKKGHKTPKEFIKELESLTTPINIFFDKVLVNDPDPKIKASRQALLKKGKDLFEKICDFNKIIERN